MSYLFDDANSQYINYALGSSNNYSDPFTLVAWFRADAQHTGTVFSFGDSAGNHTQFVGVVNDGTVRCVSVSTSFAVGIATTTTTYSTGTWHHIAGVFASDLSRSIYLDGTNKVTDTSGVLLSGFYDRFCVGQRAFSAGGEFFSGDIAECCILVGALSDSQIASLAYGTSPQYFPRNNIFSYVPLIRSKQCLKFAWTITESASAPTVSPHPRVLYPARTHSLDLVPVAATGHPAMSRWRGIPGMKYNGRRGW